MYISKMWSQIVAFVQRILGKTMDKRNSVIDDNRGSTEYAYGIEDEENQNRVSSKITIVIQ